MHTHSIGGMYVRCYRVNGLIHGQIRKETTMGGKRKVSRAQRAQRERRSRERRNGITPRTPEQEARILSFVMRKIRLEREAEDA